MSESFIKSAYACIPPYVTKDGSVIRELMHPSVHGNNRQSLAEATIPAGGKTLRHVHDQTEEIYHITAGHGVMGLGEECLDVQPGDTICIPPGTAHYVENTGHADLKILCCCAPAYSHEDTRMIE